MPDNSHFDDLEIRDAELREAEQFALLPDLIAAAKEKAPGWAWHLENIDAEDVVTRAALSQLPVLRKSDLVAKQAENPPFGGFATTPTSKLGRLFMSPGPIFDPQGKGADWWRVARALFAAGFRPGDIVHNSFAYHLTPAGHMFEGGAQALGCAVIPAGVGNTEMQVEAIAHLKPDAYVGTPDFLKTLLDKGQASGKDLSSITRACVSGAALPPSLRNELKNRGVNVLQCYGTADLGIIAYETPALEGMVVDEGVIVEIVTPGTGDCVSAGDVGEVVVTCFNPDYPMIRFATGDMSAVMAGPSPCGRTNMRIKGWMGRADQAAKVKGMFVHPGQVASVAKKHGELGRVRLVITRKNERDMAILKAESSILAPDFAEMVAASVQDLCKVRADVELVALNSLPNDGLIIADERSYD
jgi:phenylacetate-coenzyme A ligase PaaK-like adenylate-forming protein